MSPIEKELDRIFQHYDTLPRRYSDTKDPSEMNSDEYDDYVSEVEFRADSEKDDKMMDGITDNEHEWRQK